VAVSSDHSRALGSSHRIVQLHNRRTVKLVDEGLVSWESGGESVGEGVVIDDGRDGRSDRGTDGREEGQEGEDGGDVFVFHGGHDGYFLADDESSSAEGDEYLALGTGQYAKSS
jgi:hypothetical protein